MTTITTITTLDRFDVARISDFTHDSISMLSETYGLTKAQVIMLAVERLTRDLNPVNGNDYIVENFLADNE